MFDFNATAIAVKSNGVVKFKSSMVELYATPESRFMLIHSEGVGAEFQILIMPHTSTVKKKLWFSFESENIFQIRCL